MKRILFIMNNFNYGGVEKTLLNLIGKIDRKKYSVELLVLEAKGEFLQSVSDDIKIIQADMPERWRAIVASNSVGSIASLKSWVKNGQILTAFTYIWLRMFNFLSCKFFKKEQFFRVCAKKVKLVKDVDIVCDYHGYAHFTTCLASRFADVPRYTWVHASELVTGYSYMADIYEKFNRIFAVSEECAKNFRECLPQIEPSKTQVLYNLIDCDEINEKSKQTPAVSYPESPFFVVSVGRLVREKAFSVAIDVADILRKKGFDFFWLIIGDGAQREELRSLIDKYGLGDRVVLHGRDSNPYCYVSRADLYVQTSISEGFATTISEAISLGIPVVTTEVSGVNQQITNGTNGFISGHSAEEIAEIIARIIRDPELLKVIQEGARATVLAQESTLPTLDNVFNNV